MPSEFLEATCMTIYRWLFDPCSWDAGEICIEFELSVTCCPRVTVHFFRLTFTGTKNFQRWRHRTATVCDVCVAMAIALTGVLFDNIFALYNMYTNRCLQFKDHVLCCDFRSFVQETTSIAKDVQQMFQLLMTKSRDPTGDLPLDPTGCRPPLLLWCVATAHLTHAPPLGLMTSTFNLLIENLQCPLKLWCFMANRPKRQESRAIAKTARCSSCSLRA